MIGGATEAVERAVAAFRAEGVTAARIPVSHAFHTSIVAPASEPLKEALRRLDLHAPMLPIVSNVTGDFYPPEADVETMLDLLGRQVASPVQFVRGLHTLYDAGARVFVEVGPEEGAARLRRGRAGRARGRARAVHQPPQERRRGLVQRGTVRALGGRARAGPPAGRSSSRPPSPPGAGRPAPRRRTAPERPRPPPAARTPMSTDNYVELGHLFADVLEQGLRVYRQAPPGPRRAGRPEADA